MTNENLEQKTEAILNVSVPSGIRLDSDQMYNVLERSSREAGFSCHRDYRSGGVYYEIPEDFVIMFEPQKQVTIKADIKCSSFGFSDNGYLKLETDCPNVSSMIVGSSKNSIERLPEALQFLMQAFYRNISNPESYKSRKENRR